MIALVALLSWVSGGPPDTLLIRPLRSATPPVLAWDSTVLGPPQVQFETGQGRVLVWLFRWRDTVFLRATISDSTPYWGDDFVISLDTRVDPAASAQHDDFRWYFRRVTDSSVIYRGREGRWQAPRDDLDWRLGSKLLESRSGRMTMSRADRPVGRRPSDGRRRRASSRLQCRWALVLTHATP